MGFLLQFGIKFLKPTRQNMNKKLGYYTVGSKIFYSKVEACIFATQVFKKIDPNLNIQPYQLVKWNFNNDVFAAYDWTQEPELSLDDLYDKRARELREKYDYIIISYSGGADSHNVVMSFLRQGLFIDEIVITHMHDAMKNFAQVDETNHAAKYCFESEFQLQAKLRLFDIANLSPKTKITEIDTSKLVLDFFNKNNNESWVLKVREELNPIDAARYDFCKFAEIERKIDTDKKIGIILGVDKAKIRLNNLMSNHSGSEPNQQKVDIVFSDRTVNQTPISESLAKYTNSTIEFFYWSPDACDILCKQAHIQKKWLQKNPIYQQFFTNSASILRDNREVTDRVLRPILYSTWNRKWFQAEKNQLDWHAEHDDWFITGQKNTLEYSLWQSGLNFVTKNCTPFVKYYLDDPALFADGLMRIKNFYKIGYITNSPSLDTNKKSAHESNDRKLINITEKDLENIIYMT